MERNKIRKRFRKLYDRIDVIGITQRTTANRREYLRNVLQMMRKARNKEYIKLSDVEKEGENIRVYTAKFFC